jgi:hypothetical protein
MRLRLLWETPFETPEMKQAKPRLAAAYCRSGGEILLASLTQLL